MDLQAEINAAVPGSTIRISDNETCTGSFVVNKSLNIVGGAGSKIISPQVSPTQFVAEPPIIIPPGTGPVSLTNLEITVQDTVTKIFDLIRFGTGDLDQNTLAKAPQGLTIDKCDIHGLPNADSQRGISANGANFKITNSKVREIHGRGYDTQAICSWNGPGPFTILDCYLEGSGENVMFGGSPPTIPGLIHTGIEFRRNHCFKPLAWKGVWTVKNLFELKNARNVIVDGNVFENCWTDAQAGWAIQFTPRPSDSGSAALIEDVQFTNNTIRNSDQGANILGADQPPAPTDTRLKRLRIANNLFIDIRGTLFTITNKTDAVTIEHNTAVHAGNIISADYAPNTGFVYRYNIVRHNDYGVFGSGSSPGNASLNFYFPNSVFTENVIAQELNGPSNWSQIYPAGNKFPVTLSEAIGADYKPTPTYAGYGCDIDALNAAQAGTAPIPIPIPVPPIVPTPIPPTIVRKVAFPTGEAKQNAIVELQWRDRYRFKRHLVGSWAEFEKVP